MQPQRRNFWRAAFFWIWVIGVMAPGRSEAIDCDCGSQCWKYPHPCCLTWLNDFSLNADKACGTGAYRVCKGTDVIASAFVKAVECSCTLAPEDEQEWCYTLFDSSDQQVEQKCGWESHAVKSFTTATLPPDVYRIELKVNESRCPDPPGPPFTWCEDQLAGLEENLAFELFENECQTDICDFSVRPTTTCTGEVVDAWATIKNLFNCNCQIGSVKAWCWNVYDSSDTLVAGPECSQWPGGEEALAQWAIETAGFDPGSYTVELQLTDSACEGSSPDCIETLSSGRATGGFTLFPSCCDVKGVLDLGRATQCEPSGLRSIIEPHGVLTLDPLDIHPPCGGATPLAWQLRATDSNGMPLNWCIGVPDPVLPICTNPQPFCQGAGGVVNTPTQCWLDTRELEYGSYAVHLDAMQGCCFQGFPCQQGACHMPKNDVVIKTIFLGRIDLDVDTDRTGFIEGTDDEDLGEETWTVGKGAIYNVNFDRDGDSPNPAGVPDAINFGNNGFPDYEDFVISDSPVVPNADDSLDLAPMVIRKIADGVPNSLVVFLSVAEQEDIQRVHVFKRIEADPTNVAIWGRKMAAPSPPAPPDSVFLVITKFVNKTDSEFQGDPNTGDATFGIEGLSFRNDGASIPPALHFDGYVDFTMELYDLSGPVAGCSDSVTLKVAPWMMLPNAEASQEVWAENSPGYNEKFLYDLSADPPYKGLDHSNQLVQPPPDHNDTLTQWLQDHLEIGYTERPGGPQTTVVLRLPYGVQPPWPMTRLLGADVGVFQLGEWLNPAHPSADIGGNLEVLPGDAAHELGIVVLGDSKGPSNRLKDFLLSQEVQVPAFNIPIEWLRVGHIDEITSFLAPGTVANPGTTVAIADPEEAWDLLTSLPGEGVFFAFTPPGRPHPVFGTALADSTAPMRIETGIDHRGTQWKYIRVYSGSQAGTIGFIDERGNGYLTLLWAVKTGSKIIMGGSPDYDIYHWTERLNVPPSVAIWRPEKGSDYVLCEDSLKWESGTPAIVTVREVLQDPDFQHLNRNLVQARVDAAQTELQNLSSGLRFKELPCLFFGTYVSGGDIIDHTGLAFNPGPTNLQPVNGTLYVPRQFGPLDSGNDVFEESIRGSLGVPVEFVDDWSYYHTVSGEVHCGSNVKRVPPSICWWEKQP